MTSPFDGLPDVFTGAFGQAVTVTPSGGSPREITAVFTSDSVDVLDVALREPILAARSADVSDIADGDEIALEAETYIARTIRPDGRGMTRITLELKR